MSSSQQLARTLPLTGAVAAAAAAYILLLAPADRSLRSARADLQAAYSKLSLADTPTLTPNALEALRARSRNIRENLARASSVSVDADTLYAHLTSLAETHGVRIETLEPTLSPQIPQPHDPTIHQPGHASKTTQISGGLPPDEHTTLTQRFLCTLSVVGPYTSVAKFIAAVEARSGLAIVRSVRLTPTEESGQQLTEAVIRTEHFAIVPDKQHNTLTVKGTP